MLLLHPEIMPLKVFWDTIKVKGAWYILGFERKDTETL